MGKAMIIKFMTLLVTSVITFTKICYAQVNQDWSSEYHRLSTKIEKEFSEPRGDPPQLEPYLRWMESKAIDRDKVISLLEEAKAYSEKNPNDEVAKIWVNKFSDLLRLAQNSGENTVNGAVMRLMRIRDPKFPESTNWMLVIDRLKRYGRPIYLKAMETKFLTPDVKATAKCMINFSIRSVEADPYGFGVYEGREGTLNIPGGRDFDVDCEPRSSFAYSSKGEPKEPTDRGLDWINQVREEARWWQFSDAVNDATDLMEEYYENSMCKAPPNDCSKGHKHYHKLAEKYNLPRGLKYNESFYGTIYGRVELISSKGRNPASGAKITVLSIVDGESWSTYADSQGNYEIKNVLLHKECELFEITAVHDLGKAQDYFSGPLEKPNPSFRFEKNLEIFVDEWVGILRLWINLNVNWGNSETRKYPDGTISEIVKEQVKKIWYTNIYVSFRFDPSQKKPTLVGKSVSGFWKEMHFTQFDTYGRCRKHSPWTVINVTKRKEKRTAHLIDKITSIYASIKEIPGYISSFQAGVNDFSSIMQSVLDSTEEETKSMCENRFDRESPPPIIEELPFGVPFVFGENKEYPTDSFTGVNKVKSDCSFYTLINGDIPCEYEIQHIWSVWRNKPKKR